MKRILIIVMIVLIVGLLLYNVSLSIRLKECEKHIDIAYSLIGEIAMENNMKIEEPTSNIDYNEKLKTMYNVQNKLLLPNPYISFTNIINEQIESGEIIVEKETGNR